MSRNTLSRGELNLYKQYEQGTDHKPRGLWYQIGISWEAWCFSEMPMWLTKYTQKVHLELDMSRILVIRNEEELLEFTAEYGVPLSERTSRSMDYIDWARVAEKYDGIDIPKYLRSMRLDSRVSWYYTWDIASGCIWNLRAIKSHRSEPFHFEPDEGMEWW